MGSILGRKLEPNEVVHHKRALNGNAEDALLLYVLSSFDYVIDEIIKENSKIFFK